MSSERSAGAMMLPAILLLAAACSRFEPPVDAGRADLGPADMGMDDAGPDLGPPEMGDGGPTAADGGPDVPDMASGTFCETLDETIVHRCLDFETDPEAVGGWSATTTGDGAYRWVSDGGYDGSGGATFTVDVGEEAYLTHTAPSPISSGTLWLRFRFDIDPAVAETTPSLALARAETLSPVKALQVSLGGGRRIVLFPPPSLPARNTPDPTFGATEWPCVEVELPIRADDPVVSLHLYGDEVELTTPDPNGGDSTGLWNRFWVGVSVPSETLPSPVSVTIDDIVWSSERIRCPRP